MHSSPLSTSCMLSLGLEVIRAKKTSLLSSSFVFTDFQDPLEILCVWKWSDIPLIKIVHETKEQKSYLLR